MMWDHVMEQMKTVILANPTLGEIFGTNYRKAGVSKMTVPSIEWTLLTDTEGELWAPMLVQFDLWTSRASDERRAERALRGLLHKTTSITFDTYTMFTEYADGGELAMPDRAGHTGRGLRFRMSPLREQYARPEVVSS